MKNSFFRIVKPLRSDSRINFSRLFMKSNLHLRRSFVLPLYFITIVGHIVVPTVTTFIEDTQQCVEQQPRLSESKNKRQSQQQTHRLLNAVMQKPLWWVSLLFFLKLILIAGLLQLFTSVCQIIWSAPWHYKVERSNPVTWMITQWVTVDRSTDYHIGRFRIARALCCLHPQDRKYRTLSKMRSGMIIRRFPSSTPRRITKW